MAKRIDYLFTLLRGKAPADGKILQAFSPKDLKPSAEEEEPTIIPHFLDEPDRKRHYRICHAIAKQYDLYPEMRAYMQRHWGKTSMLKITDANLQDLLAFMRSMEAKILNT